MPSPPPPAVTVVMTTYNHAPYLRVSLGSILAQTLPPRRIIVVNDGSTDETAAILADLGDPRLTLLSNPANRGISFSLNRALALVDTPFVALMDSDDIALPTRLAQQAAHLLRHPTLGVCGGYMEMFDSADPTRTRLRLCPLEPDAIRCALLFGNPMANPTAFFNLAAIPRRALRYRPAFAHAEDYDLWARLSERVPFANLPEVLVRYRLHPHSATHLHEATQRHTADCIRARLLRRLSPDFSEAEIALHNRLCNAQAPIPEAERDPLRRWLHHLLEQNHTHHYPPSALEQTVAPWLARLA